MVAVLLLSIVWFLFTVWQSNRISDQFRNASKLAYRSVRECNDKTNEEDSSFVRCLDTAQTMVIRVGQLARTSHERKQYADLHSFLSDVSQYHKKLLSSASPDELREMRENMNRFEGRLEETFR